MLAAPGTFTGTQSLSPRVDPLHFCVKSPSASPRFRVRYPGQCAVVSPNGPAARRPLAAAVAGSGWRAPRDEKAIKSGSWSETCSSRTAWVAARSSRAGGARRPWRAAAPRPAQTGWTVSQKLASLILSPLG